MENKENKRKGFEGGDDRAPKKPFNKSKTSSSSTASSSAAQSDDRNPYPPPLTTTERELLAANEGCNRCRKPFAGHHPRDCSDPMTRATYAPVTEQSIADARRARKGKGTASGSSSSGGTSKAVAAVMPPVVSDSDDDSDTADDQDLSRSD